MGANLYDDTYGGGERKEKEKRKERGNEEKRDKEKGARIKEVVIEEREEMKR